jgi:hypothetical protein
VDSNDNPVLTPVRDQRITAGEHTVELVADKDPSRTWSAKRDFVTDSIITVNAMEGDW